MNLAKIAEDPRLRTWSFEKQSAFADHIYDSEFTEEQTIGYSQEKKDAARKFVHDSIIQEDIGGAIGPIRRGVAQLGAIPAGVFELAATWMPSDLPAVGQEDFEEYAEWTRKHVMQPIAGERNATGRYAMPVQFKNLDPSHPRSPLNPKRVYNVVAQGLPLLAAFMATAAFNPFLSGALMFAIEGGDSAKRLREYEERTGVKIPDWQKKTIPLVVGFVNTMLESYSTGTLLGKTGLTRGMKSKIGRALVGGIIEGSEEFSQEGMQIIGQLAAGNEDAWKGNFEELWDNFYGGALLGGVVGGVYPGKATTAEEVEAGKVVVEGKPVAISDLSTNMQLGVTDVLEASKVNNAEPTIEHASDFLKMVDRLYETYFVENEDSNPDDFNIFFEQLNLTAPAGTKIEITDEAAAKDEFTATYEGRVINIRKAHKSITKVQQERVINALTWLQKNFPVHMKDINEVVISHGGKRGWFNTIAKELHGIAFTKLSTTHQEGIERKFAKAVGTVEPTVGKVLIRSDVGSAEASQKFTSDYINTIAHEVKHLNIAKRPEQAELAVEEMEAEAFGNKAEDMFLEAEKGTMQNMQFQHVEGDQDIVDIPDMRQRAKLIKLTQGLFSNVRQANVQLYDNEGEPVNAMIDPETGGLQLSRNVRWDTVGHEATELIIAELGLDHPLVKEGLALFKGDKEKLSNAVGSYFAINVKIETGSILQKVEAWLQKIWAAFKSTVGNPQQLMVNRINKIIIGEKMRVIPRLKFFDNLTKQDRVNLRQLPLKNIPKEEHAIVNRAAKRLLDQGQKVVSAKELEDAIINDLVDVVIMPERSQEVADVDEIPEEHLRRIAAMPLSDNYTAGDFEAITHRRLLFDTGYNFGQEAHTAIPSETALGWTEVADSKDGETLIVFEVQPSDGMKELDFHDLEEALLILSPYDRGLVSETLWADYGIDSESVEAMFDGPDASDIVSDYRKEIQAALLETLDKEALILSSLSSKVNRFMYRSLIQWAARQGYKKIRFPYGDTIEAIEGNRKAVELYNNVSKRMLKEYKGRAKVVTEVALAWLEITLNKFDITSGAYLYQYKKNQKKADEDYKALNINLDRKNWTPYFKDLAKQMSDTLPTVHREGFFTMMAKATEIANDPDMLDKAIDGLIEGKGPYESVAINIAMEEAFATAHKKEFEKNPKGAAAAVIQGRRLRFLRLLSLNATRAGRTLNYQNMFSPFTRMMLDIKDGRRILSKADEKMIADAVKVGVFSNPYKVRDLMRKLDHPKKMDYVWSIYYNGILSGPPTHIVNLASNTVWLNFQPVHRAMTAMIESAMSSKVAQAIFPKLKGHEQQRFFSESLAMYSGAIFGVTTKSGHRAGGIIASLKHIPAFYKGGVVPPNLISKWQMELGSARLAWSRWAERPGSNPFRKFLASVFEAPSRALIVSDIFFRSLAYDAQLQALHQREAVRQGVDIRDIILTEEQKDAHVEDASKFAAMSTFSDKQGTLSNAAYNLRELIPMGRAVIPFVNTMSNILIRGVQMTPGLGIVQRLKTKVDMREPIVDTMAKQIEGLLAAMVLLTLFWDDDKITGTVPVDKGKREAFYRAGKLPNAFKVGKTWIQYTRWTEPFSIMIAAIVALRDGIKNREEGMDIEERFITVAWQVSDVILQNSFADNLKRITDREGVGLKRWIDRLPSTFVPYSSFLRMIQRSYEAWEKGGAVLKENNSIMANLANNIPWLPDAPARFDAFGEEILLSPSKNKYAAVLKQWMPFRWQEAKDDIVETELQRLGVYPRLPGKYLTISGVTIEMDDALWREYAMITGKDLKKEYTKVISSLNYARLSSRAQLRYLDRVGERVRSRRREQVRALLKKSRLAELREALAEGRTRLSK